MKPAPAMTLVCAKKILSQPVPERALRRINELDEKYEQGRLTSEEEDEYIFLLQFRGFLFGMYAEARDVLVDKG
jgi:hypothetical protein